MRFFRGVTFSLTLFLLLAAAYTLISHVRASLTPSSAYFEVESVTPVMARVGVPLLFRTIREDHRGGNLAQRHWLYCDYGQGWERVSTHAAADVAQRDRGYRAIWRFGGETPYLPPQPGACFLVSQTCLTLSPLLEKCETLQTQSFEVSE